MTTRLAEGAALCGGRYRLERLLGAGGMASVWLARDQSLGRLVAIKVISDTLAATGRYVERFEREARIAAGLSHPNLVKVFDYATDGERPLLVMEYVEGGTLAAVKHGSFRRVPDPERVARDLLAALAHIDDAGIVHRDVKPANVLVDRDGRARLTDFGIARPDDATRFTMTGEVIGTLKYIAPEVLEGNTATARSDLYSLGVVLTEYTEGAPPPGLARLIAELAAPDPAHRPASARMALHKLDAGAKAPEPDGTDSTRRLETRPTGPTLRLPRTEASVTVAGREVKVVIEPLKALLVVGSLVLLLIAGLALSSGDDGGAPADSPGAQSPPPQDRTLPPPDAPLEEQLDALERAVRDAAAR